MKQRLVTALSFPYTKFKHKKHIKTIFANNEKKLLYLMQFMAIIESSDDAIVSKTLEGIVTSWNAGAERMFGYSSSEVIGKSISFLIPKDLHAEEVLLLDQVRMGKLIKHHETFRKCKNGDLINVSVNLTPIRDADGNIIGVSKIARDITEQKNAEMMLCNKESRFRLMLENSPIAVRIAGKSPGKVLFANSNYCELIQCTHDQVKEVNPRHYYSNPQDYDEIVEQINNGVRINNRLVKLETKSKIKWALASYIDSTFEDQPAIIGWFYDITDRINIEQHSHHLAYSDALTKLPNRRLFDDRLKQAISASKRSNLYGAVIFMDLNKFKPLNDLHGHAMGDLLLIEVGRRIQKCVREMDTVARFGGDEFVVLLTGLNIDEKKSKEEVGIITNKIRDSLAETYFLKPNKNFEASIEHHCSSSIGVTLFNGQDNNSEDIVKRADEAMYQAKVNNPDLINFYLSKD